ncbi:hypothetical protein DCS_00625 [Drechmeria coniospora]|uniref:Uncharacterized protein n=1 Tax=Drechmeria coniospora TaxID=98403 RepID=A0A151GQV3_DRECN|nr:hypothetical protein DCS_00625 [Drechmeria coniospora]KYK59495.1 hypothetical protein DCS_00625 [Drechmeria coniospora]
MRCSYGVVGTILCPSPTVRTPAHASTYLYMHISFRFCTNPAERDRRLPNRPSATTTSAAYRPDIYNSRRRSEFILGPDDGVRIESESRHEPSTPFDPPRSRPRGKSGLEPAVIAIRFQTLAAVVLRSELLGLAPRDRSVRPSILPLVHQAVDGDAKTTARAACEARATHRFPTRASSRHASRIGVPAPAQAAAPLGPRGCGSNTCTFDDAPSSRRAAAS